MHWLPDVELEAARYLVAFWAYAPEEGALALSDVAASGRVLYYAGPLPQIENILAAFTPPEVLVYEGQDTLLPSLYSGATHVEVLGSWYSLTNRIPPGPLPGSLQLCTPRDRPAATDPRWSRRQCSQRSWPTCAACAKQPYPTCFSRRDCP